MILIELLIIISGVIVGNELIIRIHRSHSLSNHKMVNRKHQQKIKENNEIITTDKKRN